MDQIPVEPELQVPLPVFRYDILDGPFECKVIEKDGKLYAVYLGSNEVTGEQEEQYLLLEEHSASAGNAVVGNTAGTAAGNEEDPPVQGCSMDPDAGEGTATTSDSEYSERLPEVKGTVFEDAQSEEDPEPPSIPINPYIKNKDRMVVPFGFSGQTFGVQARKLILNVYHFFKWNEEGQSSIGRMQTVQEQAGKILNVSRRAIEKIRKRYRKMGRVVVGTKKRIRVKPVLETLNKQLIRDLITELASNGTPPTVSALLDCSRTRFGFVGSRASFRRVLVRMGLKY